jgi:uncharacterized membrane protein
MSIESLFPITLIAATFFATLVAGFLFGFAIVAMPGIKRLTDREFIRAFQAMDRIIQNNHPLFMLVWGGSALLLVIAAALGVGQLAGGARLLLIAATLIFMVGVHVPTVTINVPLNNTLQTVDVDATNAAAHTAARNDFEPRWNQWNQIRTVCASVASALLLMVLVLI